MTKTLEKVAAHIADALNSWDIMIPSFVREGKIVHLHDVLAKEIIDALDILVLPAGSEPEVGDTLLMDSGAELEAWVLEQEVSTPYWEELYRQGCRIIKRGNSLVIMEDE